MMINKIKEGKQAIMPTDEQIKALEKVFDYIDKNEGITFAGVVRHFRQYNGGGFIDPSFKILTTDWGTRTVLAYLDD